VEPNGIARPTSTSLWSRRRFLKTGLAVGSGALAVGAGWWLSLRPAGPGGSVEGRRASGSVAVPLSSAGTSRSPDASPSATAPPPRRHFRSRPDLSAPIIELRARAEAIAPGSIFFTPNNGQAPDGLLIVDDMGEPIWIRPDGELHAAAFRVSAYRGRPVLTWWEGTVNNGLGDGHYVVADETYREIARVTVGEGLSGDLHEFLVTSDDTALVLAGRQVAPPVLSGSRPPPWPVWDCVVLEIDIATGERLFEWHSVDHVDVAESYATPPVDGQTIFDYVHANSIDVDRDGHLLVSARNTSAVYKIDRSTGAILWRLGGRGSSFALGEGAAFSLQHDARRQPNGRLTIFDDEAAPTPSRAIFLRLDETAMTAELERSYGHPRGLTVSSQGNAQALPGGDVFVGWGSAGDYSEFRADGELQFDASFAGSRQSYRCFRFPWVGRPTERPALAVEAAGPGASTAFCSWNGATVVASWEVLAGSGTTDLRRVGARPRTGFETVIGVADRGPRFVARALDDRGRVLATSRTVTLAS
jgi:Arylsulfotransferase (ASST)